MGRGALPEEPATESPVACRRARHRVSGVEACCTERLLRLVLHVLHVLHVLRVLRVLHVLRVLPAACVLRIAAARAHALLRRALTCRIPVNSWRRLP